MRPIDETCMKLLSVRQPHAHLLRFQGVKLHETRNWKTNYRGPLGIHAAQKIPTRAEIELIRIRAGGLSLEVLPDDPASYTYGALIAVGELQGAHRITPELAEAQTPVELAVGFWERRYAWEISGNLALLEPIPMLGQLKLWDWEGNYPLETLPPLRFPPEALLKAPAV